MGLVLVTPPADEPLAPIEVVQHLRLGEDTEEDDLLSALTTAARERVEAETHRALLTQTWDLVLDAFPACNGVIRVPKPPLQGVTHVKYIDTAGVEQTLAASEYLVDTASIVGRIAPAYGKSWPSTRDQPNAVRVRFVAGYGDAAAVPQGAKVGMKLLLGFWYQNREAMGDDIPAVVKAVLSPYKIVEVA